MYMYSTRDTPYLYGLGTIQYLRTSPQRLLCCYSRTLSSLLSLLVLSAKFHAAQHLVSDRTAQLKFDGPRRVFTFVFHYVAPLLNTHIFYVIFKRFF